MSRPENADGFDVEAVKQQIEQIENQIAILPLAQAITDSSSDTKANEYSHSR